MGALAGILGHIMKFFYDIVQNYGVAILMFTLTIRLILLPLNLKQQKSMAKMQKINPLLTELQNKYKNDKEKLNQETMKLYQKYKISPMSGCLPMLIQFPILIALIWVIYDPAWYMFGVDTANAVSITGIDKVQLAKLTMAVQECGLNSKFLGIDLVSTPNLGLASELWIFPLIATGLTFLSGKISQSQTAPGANDQTAQTGKMMTTIFPIMTLFFTFTMPVAASFYWSISSGLQIIQMLVLKKLVRVDDMIIDDGGTWHERNSKKR